MSRARVTELRVKLLSRARVTEPRVKLLSRARVTELRVEFVSLEVSYKRILVHEFTRPHKFADHSALDKSLVEELTLTHVRRVCSTYNATPEPGYIVRQSLLSFISDS